jgi:hypothetical protein
MSWDDLEKGIDMLTRDFIREIESVNKELEHRDVPSVKALHARVKKIREFFVRGSWS